MGMDLHDDCAVLGNGRLSFEQPAQGGVGTGQRHGEWGRHGCDVPHHDQQGEANNLGGHYRFDRLVEEGRDLERDSIGAAGAEGGSRSGGGSALQR